MKTVLLIIALVYNIASSQKKIPENRIIYGQQVDPRYEKYAFVGLLSVTRSENNIDQSWICGCSILNQIYLLTAAHCLDQTHMSVTVTVGHLEKYKGKVLVINRFHKHERFKVDGLENDIAIMMSKNKVIFDGDVNRVSVMRTPPSNEPGKVVGWGVSDLDRNTRPAYLHVIYNIKVMSKNFCKDTHRSKRPIFCALQADGIGYPYKGDSGGPLFIRNFIQIGIVSHRFESHGNAIVYTNVSHFFDWIVTTTRNLTNIYECHMKPKLVI